MPGIGEVRSLIRVKEHIENEEYRKAAVELVLTFGRFIPVGKIINATGDLIQAFSKAMKAMRIIKILGNVSSKYLENIKKFALDNKIKFKYNETEDALDITDAFGTENIGRISPDGVIDINSAIFRGIINTDTIKDLKKLKIPDDKAYSFRRSNIDPVAAKFSPNDPELKPIYDDIVNNGDNTGKKTEQLMEGIFNRSGYEVKEGVYNNSNNGIDGLFVKYKQNGDIDHIIIGEAKQWTGSNAPKLNTTAFGTQMSTKWLMRKAEQLRDANLHESADIVEAALADPSLVTKIIVVVDRTPTGTNGGLAGRVNLISIDDLTP